MYQVLCVSFFLLSQNVTQLSLGFPSVRGGARNPKGGVLRGGVEAWRRSTACREHLVFLECIVLIYSHRWFTCPSPAVPCAAACFPSGSAQGGSQFSFACGHRSCALPWLEANDIGLKCVRSIPSRINVFCMSADDSSLTRSDSAVANGAEAERWNWSARTFFTISSEIGADALGSSSLNCVRRCRASFICAATVGLTAV